MESIPIKKKCFFSFFVAADARLYRGETPFVLGRHPIPRHFLAFGHDAQASTLHILPQIYHIPRGMAREYAAGRCNILNGKRKTRLERLFAEKMGRAREGKQGWLF